MKKLNFFNQNNIHFEKEYLFHGTENEFENVFYNHVTKGEVGYHHKSFELLKSGIKPFIGQKTLDNKGNYRVRMSEKQMPFSAKSAQVFLEIQKKDDGLKILATTKPNDGELFFYKIFPVLAIIFITPIAIVVIKSFWVVIPIIAFYTLFSYINYVIVVNSIKSLNSRFHNYFINWDKIEPLKK